ncbi:PH domain-containing protein [Flaviflexus ciconiae]|uniref:PH domain-containing protein n=1 Tax=Flaviflexus ciconiae TaxID=2496867 RepID=A0A3S9PW78_9ACTO|nr:PH domain-containing protein [Flaviflexus ciconiae]AZQ76633.1 PH domain-containing protein [Flaviflexus ciconiae]
MDAALVTQWTFFEEVPIPSDVASLLVEGEEPYAAFKTFRDSAIFTSKRLIVRDSQGMTGKKVEIYSVPYSSINMWSTENAGRLDMNAEIELWTRAGHIKISVGKKIDVRRIDMLIANSVLLNS